MSKDTTQSGTQSTKPAQAEKLSEAESQAATAAAERTMLVNVAKAEVKESASQSVMNLSYFLAKITGAKANREPDQSAMLGWIRAVEFADASLELLESAREAYPEAQRWGSVTLDGMTGTLAWWRQMLVNPGSVPTAGEAVKRAKKARSVAEFEPTC